MLPTTVFLGFPCGSAGKESTCNAGDLGLIPGFRRSPREGKGNALQCSCLENSKGLQRLDMVSDFHFTSLYRLKHKRSHSIDK